jgi:predicted MFS family arabinose efflux permease
LIGAVVIMVGIVLVGTAKGFGQGVAGMALSGAGAAVCELTALAGISDIVPVSKRGVSLALVVGSILPFTPYVMYAQLLSTHSTWRWTMWICLIYNAIVFVGLATTYFPKSHPRMEGFSKLMILKQIDYVGAGLSVVGITIL